MAENIKNINPNLAGNEPKKSFDTSIFEPAAEIVLLPSKGVFYTEVNKIIREKEGKIEIRPMTLKEENMLTNPRLVKTGTVLTAMLKSTIKTPGVDVDELLSFDRMFLFYYLRSISYGDEYNFKMTCQECGKSFDYSVRLSELDIKYADDNEKEPFVIELPTTKRKVSLRHLRGKDEYFEGGLKGQTDGKSDIIDDLIKITIDIEGVPRLYWRKFYESLSIKDSGYLRKKIDEKEFGLDSTITITCPYCESTYTDSVPITPSFFRI